MNPDVVVIGAGTAGMTAALRLSGTGATVLVLAEGEGALPLAPAQVDLLGYTPALVSEPLRELAPFLQERPWHPYRLVTPDEIEAALGWFADLAAPLGYVGSAQRNRLQPTALGALRPTCLVPETMASGDLSEGGEVLVVGLRGFRDFHAQLVAENLGQAHLASGAAVGARAVEVSLVGDPRDLRPQLLVRRLEQRAVLAQLAREIRTELGQETLIALPAVLGMERSHEVWQRLQELLGRPVFEIPTPPPSQPGQRLQQVLFRALRRQGGEVRLGAKATGFRGTGGRVESITVQLASREVQVSAGEFILASGGLGTGGVTVDPDGGLHEPVFDLPVTTAGAPGQPSAEYFATQPLDRLGVSVDSEMRPLGTGGEPLFTNLRAAGAVLGGAEPWREKSGEGISLATGFRAAAVITGGGG